MMPLNETRRAIHAARVADNNTSTRPLAYSTNTRSLEYSTNTRSLAYRTNTRSLSSRCWLIIHIQNGQAKKTY